MLARRLQSGESAHLRGNITGLDTSLAGRPCRGALSALVARQYYEVTTAIAPKLRCRLQSPSSAARHPPRDPPPAVLVYTDASAEGGKPPRVGVLVYDPGRALA